MKDKAHELLARIEVMARVSGHTAEECERIIRGLVDEGFILARIKPTKEMILAGETAHEDCLDRVWDSGGGYESAGFIIASDAPIRVYEAMIAEALPDESDEECDN